MIELSPWQKFTLMMMTSSLCFTFWSVNLFLHLYNKYWCTKRLRIRTCVFYRICSECSVPWKMSVYMQMMHWFIFLINPTVSSFDSHLNVQTYNEFSIMRSQMMSDTPLENVSFHLKRVAKTFLIYSVNIFTKRSSIPSPFFMSLCQSEV